MKGSAVGFKEGHIGNVELGFFCTCGEERNHEQLSIDM